jgi:hypothetical protein
MRLRVLIIFSCLMLFVAQSCGQKQPENPTIIPTQRSTDAPGMTPSPVATKALPTSTPSYDEEAHYQTKCFVVDQNISSNQASNGVIVFENREDVNGRYAPGTMLFGLSSRDKSEVQNPDEHILDIKPSPDRTRIAYKLIKDGVSPDTLVIADSDFQQIKTIAWKDTWDVILGWADDSHVLLRKSNPTAATKSPLEKPPEIIQLDLNSLQEKTFKPTFPDVYDFPPLPYWEGFGTVIYSPDFSRAVYVRWTDSSRSTYGQDLWDMKDRQSLAYQEVVGNPMPRWSPDGSEFITTGLIDLEPLELFSISKDGEVKQLTFLGSHAASTEILNYFWSPDGKKIALLLKQNANTANVAVLDTDKMLVTDYCVQVTYNGDGFGTVPTPIWSPDSQQIVIQDWYAEEHRKVILIDIARGYAAQIAEDVKPFAWLKGN